MVDAKLFIEAVEEAGYEARSYSGRAMYGRDCVGVEIPRDESAFNLCAKLVRAVFDLHGDDAAGDFADDLTELRACEDAMGLDTIVYWPRLAWPEDASDDEDDDHDCDGPECCSPTSEAAAE